MKKIFRFPLFLFLFLFTSTFAINYAFSADSRLYRGINSSLDEKEWLKIYYKESTEQYGYIYDNNQRGALRTFVYNYFSESSLKSWISTSRIKEDNFVILNDSSIELKPTVNITLRAIINPQTKVISEIMLSLDKSGHVENFALFYNLSRIAIDMINTDITKYDIDSIYNQISLEQIAIDRNYSAGLLKDGVDYSVFYIQDSVFFILKRTNAELSSFFAETGEEKARNDFANEDEFFNDSFDRLTPNKVEEPRADGSTVGNNVDGTMVDKVDGTAGNNTNNNTNTPEKRATSSTKFPNNIPTPPPSFNSNSTPNRTTNNISSNAPRNTSNNVTSNSPNNANLPK